jgi:DNA replication protein
MTKFRGFPARIEFTSVPNLLFSGLLPQIDELAEVKVTLFVIAAIYRKKGAPRSVGRTELLADAAVMESLRDLGESVEDTLDATLEQAAARGTFIALAVGEGKDAETVYLLNDEAGRQTAAKVAAGELSLGGKKARPVAVAETAPPDIFTAYEENIGLLTPMIADELKDAERNYPAEWIREAIREAVLHNKRSIKYIAKILETWSVEGRSDGTYQRDTEKTDPDRYVKGKYGHIVKR